MRHAILLLLGAVLLAGCGGAAHRVTEPERVRAAVLAYGDAVAHKEYARLCTQILAPSLTGKLERAGFPCDAALERYLSPTKEPRVKILGVRVKGDGATADVQTSARGQAPVAGVLGLVKVGGSWRIEALDTPSRAR